MITLALLDYPPEDLVPLGRYSMFRVGHNNMRSFIGDRQLLVSSEVHWLLVQQASEFRTVIRLIENPISSGLYAREMLESFCGELLAHVERHHPTGVSNVIDLALRRQLLIRLLYSYAMGGKNFNNGPYLFGLDDTEMRHALRRPSPKDSARWRAAKERACARIAAYRTALGGIIPLPDQAFNIDPQRYPDIEARDTEDVVERVARPLGLPVMGENIEAAWSW